MYYNINNQLLLNALPNTIVLNNGTVITGPVNDAMILKAAGFLTVRSDTPEQPKNSTEDISKRVINIDGNVVDIIRTWTPIVSPVSNTISARQIRLWLVDNNISLTSVKAAINGIVDERLREKTLVEWEYAPYIERNHPLLDTLGKALGLTPEQIDAAFEQAAQI